MNAPVRGFGRNVTKVGSEVGIGTQNQFIDFLESPEAGYPVFTNSFDVDLGHAQIEMRGNKWCDAFNSGHRIRIIDGRVRMIGSNILWDGFYHVPIVTLPSPLSKIGNADGISAGKKAGSVVRDLAVRRCHILYSGDEGVAVWDNVSQWSFTDCIVEKAYIDIGHPDLNSAGLPHHSMIFLVGAPSGYPPELRPRYGTIAGCLLKDGQYRLPSIQDGAWNIEVLNDGLSNPGIRGINCQAGVIVIVENNDVRTGADTSLTNGMLHVPQGSATVYHAGNLIDGADLNPTGNPSGLTNTVPFTRSDWPLMPASSVPAYIQANCGPNRSVGADLTLLALDEYDKRTGHIPVKLSDAASLNYTFPGAGTTPPQTTTRKLVIDSGDWTTFDFAATGTVEVALAFRNRAGLGLATPFVSMTAGAGTFGGGATGANNPETGLTLTSSFSPGSQILGGQVFGAENAVFSFGYDQILNQNGQIFGSGGSGLGVTLAVRDGNMILRAGDGGGATADPGRDDHAYVIVPLGAWANNPGRLTSVITPGANTVRLVHYVSGTDTATDLGTPVARASGSSDWTNGGTGAYLTDDVTVAGGEPNNPAVVIGATDLNYYRAQTV